MLARRSPASQLMAEIARDAGLPDGCLLVEDQSSNTMKNAEFSAELLEREGLLGTLKAVLPVSSEWHMARVLWTVKKFFPASTRFLCCPTLEGCNRSNWTKSNAFRQAVMDEAVLYTTFKGMRAAALRAAVQLRAIGGQAAPITPVGSQPSDPHHPAAE